jgi:hypothetical protein
MAAFRERFNKAPPRRATLLDWEFMVAYWSVYGDFSATLYLKVDGSMEKKWDTVIQADLKRLFISVTYICPTGHESVTIKGTNHNTACHLCMT